jgi:hypothetical protein
MLANSETKPRAKLEKQMQVMNEMSSFASELLQRIFISFLKHLLITLASQMRPAGRSVESPAF